MERFRKVTGSFLRYHYLPHLGLTALLVLASGAILSFRNLDYSGAAKVMEMYGILSGTLLLTPLFMPEADTEIWLLEKSKAMSMWTQYLGRLLIAVAFLAAVTGIFILRLKLGNSTFDAGTLWKVSFCEALFLGGIGTFAGAVTNQVVIGYMLSFIYFAANIGAAKHFGKLGLLAMMRGDATTWLWYLCAAIILVVAGILLRERKR